jgi:hypothetical protein
LQPLFPARVIGFDKNQKTCIFDIDSITYSCPDNIGGPALKYDPKTQMCK